MSTKPKAQPLPLPDTLRDLALLRASDLDLSSLLPKQTASTAKSSDEIDRSVDLSYEFVANARAAMKIANRGDVETQGTQLEGVRTRLEEVVKGVDGDQ